MRLLCVGVVVVMGLAVGACGTVSGAVALAGSGGRDSTDVGAGGAPMPLVVERYWQDERDVGSFYGVGWSEARWDRLQRHYDRWEGELEAIDFESLDVQGRIDWLLLKNHLRARRNGVELERARLAEMEELLPFREAINAMEIERWGTPGVEAREVAGIVAAIAAQAKEVRGRVKRRGDELPDPAGEESDDIRVSAAAALRAAGAVAGLRQTLRRTTRGHIDHTPGFAWWVAAPLAEAERELREYERMLRQGIAGQKGEHDDPLVGDPIGRRAIVADLRTELIDYTPEELIEIAERELAWHREQMIAAAREMGFGDDWRAAMDEVKTRSVEPGGQAVFVAEVAREAIEFLKDGDMVSIPPLVEELWRTEMIPGERQRLFPFAYYGGLHMGVAYPADGMAHDDKLATMRGNNRHFTRNVVPHELVPGHHLQRFMSGRYNPHRRLFSTPFLVEGWALYWEMVFWDRGWAQSPEDRIGILFWGKHRCARIIVSLRFHMGEMTAEEMVDFLVDEVGHERLSATGEVRRYIGEAYSPLYQVAYMIGGLQFRALWEEVVGAGRMTDRGFHDDILTYGPIPVALIRAGMLADAPEDIGRDWDAAWRWDEALGER
ncbi:MAG: DUF885 family protein [Phycisphaerales bacterium]|nr:DUF885 family protein [Phycisphaerales bacterium]